jgi:Bacterial Ig-like domain (group 1)/Filamin/ABP280 repeat
MGMASTDHPAWSSPFLRSIPVIALLLVAACGGDDLLLPRDGDPAHITVFKGGDQQATVGQPLTDSLVAEVTDPTGRPVQGVEVTFVPPSGAIIEPAQPVITDAAGHAAVHYTLSTVAGEQMIEARAPIVADPNASAIFRVIATPESPESLTIAGGNEQTAQVSTVLPQPLTVKAVDRFGNGVAGIEVTWKATGGGEVTPESVITGADGLAAVSRTLGDTPGSYGAVATAEALQGPPVTFVATAVAAPKPVLVLVTQPSEDAAAGVPLERQPELQLEDPFGAPLLQAGVSVTAQIADGSGSLGGRTTAKSDGNGKVTFTDLEFRGETGSRTLIFAAEGFIPVTSSEITVRAGPPSNDESAVQVENGTAGSRTLITIHLNDEFGNPVSGAANDLTITITGANPTADLSVSDDGGGTYSTSYIPVHVGSDVVTVQLRSGGLTKQSETRVAPGPASASSTTAEVTTGGSFLFTISMTVTVRDAQGNPVGVGGDRVEVSIDDGPAQPLPDHGDGTYSGSFLSFSPNHTIVITLNGNPIQGSPFSTP